MAVVRQALYVMKPRANAVSAFATQLVAAHARPVRNVTAIPRVPPVASVFVIPTAVRAVLKIIRVTVFVAAPLAVSASVTSPVGGLNPAQARNVMITVPARLVARLSVILHAVEAVLPVRSVMPRYPV